MRYFKSESGEVYAYEDDVDEKYIKTGLTEITEDEAMALANPAPTHEQLVALAEAERVRLRAIAGSEIEWRQIAVDDGIATEEEISALAAWRKYLVLLMRVDTASPVWPLTPAA